MTSFTLDIGGREAIGFFREVSGLDSESELVESNAATGSPVQGASEKIDRGDQAGSTISGEVTDRRHAQWIEILSLQP